MRAIQRTRSPTSPQGLLGRSEPKDAYSPRSVVWWHFRSVGVRYGAARLLEGLPEGVANARERHAYLASDPTVHLPAPIMMVAMPAFMTVPANVKFPLPRSTS